MVSTDRVLMLAVCFVTSVSAVAQAQGTQIVVSNDVTYFGRAPLNTGGRAVKLNSAEGLFAMGSQAVQVYNEEPFHVRVDRKAGLRGTWWKFDLAHSSKKKITIWARREHVRIDGEKFSIPAHQLVPSQEFDLSGSVGAASLGAERQVRETEPCSRPPREVSGLFGTKYSCEGREVSGRDSCYGQRVIQRMRTAVKNQISLTLTPTSGQAPAVSIAPGAVTIPMHRDLQTLACQPRPGHPDVDQLRESPATR
jgi:hypothetical protein